MLGFALSNYLLTTRYYRTKLSIKESVRVYEDPLLRTDRALKNVQPNMLDGRYRWTQRPHVGYYNMERSRLH